MSGLDPIGRKEVRDIIVSLKDQGKTVFFSSHILADVESVANRIAILIKGRVHKIGKLRELVSNFAGTEVVVRLPESGDAASRLKESCERTREHLGELTADLGATENVDDFVQKAHDLGCKLISVVPIHETLEDVFVRAARGESSDSGSGSGSHSGSDSMEASP
jgi:ABC-2 type transport system ATP-binding protein